MTFVAIVFVIFCALTMNTITFYCRMNTECCVCFESYQKKGPKCPKVLPCVHTFCAQCLTHLIHRGKIKCPECRSRLSLSEESVQNLPTNRKIQEYMNYSLHRRDKRHSNNENNDEIYNLPSSGIFSSMDICELHNQPYVMTLGDADSSKQKLREVCLDPQTISYYSPSTDFTKSEPAISEIPRGIQFGRIDHDVGDFTQNERNLQESRHLGTIPRDQDDVNNLQVVVPLGETENKKKVKKSSNTILMIGMVICVCILYAVTSFSVLLLLIYFA